MDDTLDLAVKLIFEKNPNLKILPSGLKELFQFSTSKNNFLFQGVIYDQIDGISMGSPLAPTLANLFMGYNEKIWIDEYTGSKPYVYKRFVDDIFAVFENEKEALEFFTYINSKHQNIKFTMDKSENGKLPFLDILIFENNPVKTSVYHKDTFTGLYLNFKSFAPFQYKKRLVGTLLDRTYKINSSWVGFDIDVKELFKFLIKNLYPSVLLDKILKDFLDRKMEQNVENSSSQTEQESFTYLTLPFLGDISKNVQRKIKSLCKKYCKDDFKLNLVFSTTKTRSYFSTKDAIPECFRSSLVYRFDCARCNSCYVGRTRVHFDERRKQHLETDLQSGVYKHLQRNPLCKSANGIDSFSVIDFAKNDFDLSLKEAMHIKWVKPDLNGQKKHVVLTLAV